MARRIIPLIACHGVESTLPYFLHEYQHHVIIAHSQYQHYHSEMTNVMEFLEPVVITIIISVSDNSS